MRPIIVWFRRDLRTEDHAALHHASAEGIPIVPLFIFDTELIQSLRSDGAVFNYQAEALNELAMKIQTVGGRLIVRRGTILDVHRSLISELNPAALYFNRDYEPYARARDSKVTDLYRRAGIEVKTFRDSVVHEPDELFTSQGKPFVVFTPYARAWKKLSHPLPFDTPRSITTPKVRSDEILDARGLRRTVGIIQPAFRGGESEARKRWKIFLARGIADYREQRDIPSLDGTSRMSAALRFGCISVRTVLETSSHHAAGAPTSIRDSVGKFIDELIWRDFYQSVLYHFPQLIHSSYRPEFDEIKWNTRPKMFEAWTLGQTGFPIVDAGMRQLRATGWMHNRIRMVVASFLTKDLRYDWRRGAAWFEEKLLDIETASNIGGWQWSASSGVDPKPMRIFNPRLQSERFDPDGAYIREYVPELRRVPAKFIHAPHEMPSPLQKELGVILGRDYPKPIVDHRSASEEFKRMFQAMKNSRTSTKLGG